MKILFVASEVAPFAKTGGLADVASALPQALKKLGHDVRLIMPKYREVDDRKFLLREVVRLREVVVPVAGKSLKASVKSAFIPNTKVQVYFLDYRPYFDREGLYVDPSSGEDHRDNDERFIFFCRGCLETLKLLHWQPDVIHCNDWQTGLIPLYLKTLYREDGFFNRTSTLFTIHNLAYQGNFPSSTFQKTGLPPEMFSPGSGVEFYGQFSFLKAGLVYSDLLNTVSERYAQEIQRSPEFGYGMEGVLKSRSKDLYGILNGVDYSIWNPEVDQFIPYKYNPEDLRGKIENKKVLLEENGLEFREDVPLIGSISRLADQKGFDLIGQAIDEMMRMDLQYILLGTGDPKYHRLFEQIKRKYPDRIAINLRFDNRLAHLIEAGCDMFLMPSRYEPCGLNQLYSLKYGTIPIVRATGGLADTITEYDPQTGKGNGFTFNNYSADEMLKAIKRALKAFADKETWIKLMRNAMGEDYSWEVSAQKYVVLYERLIKGKRP